MQKFMIAMTDYLNTFVQFVLLNLLFLICCIPVVTAGSAIAALYQVTMREARNENGYIVRYYLLCLREMLKQGTVTFVVLGGAGMLFVFSAAFWKELDTAYSLAAELVSYIGLAVVLVMCLYAFPLMARFSNTIRQTIRNSFLIAMSNGKFTIILIVLHLFELSLVYLFAPVRVFMVVVGFSFFAYFNSLFYVKFFRKFE